MPKRKDIKKILIIGAGPIVIGQACEFDYSGAQACKALKEENFKVILVNSNPATIMTDPNLADRTYIEPLEIETITRIIERERPDALLSTMGGQTALNLSIQLEKKKILKRFNVKLIGASQKVINKAFTVADLYLNYSMGLATTISKKMFDHDLLAAHPQISELLAMLAERPSIAQVTAEARDVESSGSTAG